MQKKMVSVATVVGTVLLLCGGARADMPFVRVGDLVKSKEQAPAQNTERTLPVEYYVNEALEAHTLQVQLAELKKNQEQVRKQQEEVARQQKRFRAMTDCNIKRLAEHFKNPAEVWQKMTDTYDTRERDLAIYINSSEATRTTDADKTDISAYSDQEIAEMLVHWSLGNDILTDVYTHQDAWGERKAPRAPSFPLWQDQKFFFDREWDAYYTKLNAFFGAPANGRPVIDDRKYDYNRADEMRAAHEVYVAALKAKNPQKALLMPEALKQGPAVAPRPLPPVQESVLYIGDVAQTHQIFPAWPEPWQKQIANNFAVYNTAGEMARDFVPKSFKIRDDVAQRDPALQNNRLNVYQLQKKQVDGAKKVLEASQVNVKSMQQTVQDGLNKLQIAASADTDLLQEKAYKKVEDAIKEKKYALIAQIERQIQDNPTAYTAGEVVAALKKDPNGRTYITVQNAVNIDQLLLEAAATQALQQEQEAFAAQQKKSEDKPLDDMCLNGGV